MLHEISTVLMQKGPSVPDAGLLHGKMGLVIFFFHYARFAGDKSFEDHAMELFDSIQQQILQEYAVNYADGLAGIGSGIEYLVQYDFIEADTNDVLRDFDRTIRSAAAHGERNDISLFTGLSGLGRYFLFRVTGQRTDNEHIGTLNNKMMLIHLTDIFERLHPFMKEPEIEDVLMFLYAMNQTTIFPVKTGRLIKLFSSCISWPSQDDAIYKYKRKAEAFYSSKYHAYLSTSKPDIASGLYGGLAGLGLYVLSKLDKRHETWMKLI